MGVVCVGCQWLALVLKLEGLLQRIAVLWCPTRQREDELAHGEVSGAYGFWWDVPATLPDPMAMWHGTTHNTLRAKTPAAPASG